MARFARGSSGIQSAAQRSGGGKFTPSIRWGKDGETKYIQFLTPIEDTLTVFFHSFMVVGYKDDGKPIYRNFVSPKSSTDADGKLVLDRDAVDPIWDRFDIPARKRTFALAVEVEPILERVKDSKGKTKKQITGFEVATREYTDKEGEEHEVPSIGLIEQSPNIFFGYLDTFANTRPIEDVVFSVTRRGKGTDTAYDFIPVGDALDEDDLDIPDELMLDLEEYLEGLWMTDEDIDKIEKLPDTHVLNEFAERNKKARASKSSDDDEKPKSSRRKSSAKAKEVEDDDDDHDDAGEEVSNNRFAQLRRNMAAKG